MVKDKSILKEVEKLKKQLKKSPVMMDGYMIKNHLSDGHVSSVFTAEKDNEDYVLKILSPHFIPWNIMYWIAFQDKHGYFDDNATNVAYWRRKVANRISRGFDSEIEILDVEEQTKEHEEFRNRGFYMPFVSYEKAKTPEEEGYVLDKVTKLKDFFNEIGMPSWSFNPDYPFFKKRKDNLRLNSKRLVIIDYEGGVLTSGKDGELDLDPVDFESVNRYIVENKQSLVDCLGSEEHKILLDSFEKCKHYTDLWHNDEKRTLLKIRSKKELQKTIDDLLDKRILTSEEADKFDENPLVKYILYHLTVHVAIGCTVGVFTGPIPVGLFPRGAWTIGNRIYHEIKGNKEKAKVHNWKVLALSSAPIPPINYFGYLIPLKQMNELNSLVYGEHVIRQMKGKTLDEYLQGRNRLVRRIIRRTIIPKDKRNFYETRRDEK